MRLASCPAKTRGGGGRKAQPLTSVLAQELLHKLVAFDIVTSTAIPRTHGLAIFPETDLPWPALTLLLLFLINQPLQTPSRALGHLDVTCASLVAEVNLK